MPCIEQVRAAYYSSRPTASSTQPTSDDASTPAETPEVTPLFFPSSISSSFWPTGCIPGLVDKERRLRLAQADDGLNELRRQLRISATLRDYKKVQVGGTSQRMGARMRSLLNRFHDKTIRCAERYSAAYGALSTLDPNGHWTARLRFLDHKKDLRAPHRNEEDESRESRRELSWIWLVLREDGPPRAEASTDEINDSKSMHPLSLTNAHGLKPGTWHFSFFFHSQPNTDCGYILTAMRVEWAKTKARADRWREEVLLVTEEMRRTICFLDWKAKWWLDLMYRPDAPLCTQRGVAAYATKQAAICRSMAMSFAKCWFPLLKAHQIPIEWPSQYIPTDPSVMDVD